MEGFPCCWKTFNKPQQDFGLEIHLCFSKGARTVGKGDVQAHAKRRAEGKGKGEGTIGEAPQQKATPKTMGRERIKVALVN